MNRDAAVKSFEKKLMEIRKALAAAIKQSWETNKEVAGYNAARRKKRA
jgi:hypothetical protein